MRATNILLSLIVVLLAAILVMVSRSKVVGSDFEARFEPASARGEPVVRERDVDASVERLAASVEVLRASVERLTEGLGEKVAAPESRSAPGADPIVVDRFAPGGRSERSEAERSLQAPPDPERRRRLDGIVSQEFGEVQRRHWLLTFDEMIDRYGTPDEIQPEPGGKIVLIYRTATADLWFDFYDGRLFTVGWNAK